MTTAAPSTALATIQPAFTDAKRLALAGFLAGYRGLTREAYALDLRQFTTWCRTRSLALFAVRRADIETFARELEGRGPGPRHRHPPAVHHRRVQVRRRGRTPRSLPGRARPSALGGLRVPRHRAGPQRARRPAGRRRAGPAGLGPAGRACADLAALPERATSIQGDRRGHRAPGPRAWPPDADHHPQGRQSGDHPAGATHRPGDRPGHRRAHRRAGIPGRGRAAAGPARGRADRPPHRPPRWD